MEKLAKMAVSALVLASAISTAPVSGEQVLLASAGCGAPSSYTTYSYDQYPNSYSNENQNYQRPRKMYYGRGQGYNQNNQGYNQDYQNYYSGEPTQSYRNGPDQSSMNNQGMSNQSMNNPGMSNQNQSQNGWTTNTSTGSNGNTSWDSNQQ